MPIDYVFEEVGPRLEGGTYTMECTKIKEDWLENPQFGDGHVVRLTIQTTDVVDPDGNPVELEAMANCKFSSGSKLVKWMGAFGVPFKAGTGGTLEKDLTGKRALALVEVEDRGDKGLWNKVADFMPLPRSQGSPQKATSAAEKPAAASKAAAPTSDTPDPEVTAQQLTHINNLLFDCGMKWGQARDAFLLKYEHDLPETMVDLHLQSARLLVDMLNDFKNQLLEENKK